MKKLEEKLYQIHDCARKTQSVNNGYTNNAASNTVNLTPFLTVNQIAPTGPAEKAVRYEQYSLIIYTCTYHVFKR